METIHEDGVKAPQHFKTPRSHVRRHVFRCTTYTMSPAKRRRHAGPRQAEVAQFQVAPVVEEACAGHHGLDAVRTASKSKEKPATTSSDGHESIQGSEGAAAPQNAEIAPLQILVQCNFHGVQDGLHVDFHFPF